MKTLKSYSKMMAIVWTIALAFLPSCDENAFLEEKPLSIYAAENSLVTLQDFQMAVNQAHYYVRVMLFSMNNDARMGLWGPGTDFAFVACDVNKLNTWKATIVPNSVQTETVWQYLYVIVNQSNLILTRIKNADIAEADKNKLRGQALFLRAYGYRILANLYGGVPLILEEITAPRRDFVRASREETYTQAKNDLIEAVSILPDIESVRDGEIAKQAAQHLLSEIYISLGEYTNAIAAASAVINYPACKLMKTRFGSKIDQRGDVCSDLHRQNNQNRISAGNTEALWVSQYEYKGVGPGSTEFNYFNPYYSGLTITVDGVTTTAFVGNTAEKGGRSTGWSQPTNYFFDEIWEEGDLRNADYIIVRDVQIDNPQSPAFGKWLVKDGIAPRIYRNWYPLLMKISGDVSTDFYRTDAQGNYMMTAFGEHLINNTNLTFRDSYMFRLAETYLLRAEAHLGNNDLNAAAADINEIRARAQAPLINASQVDIDYILDERLRELYTEELRMCTLCRLGKFVDRVRRYNKTYEGANGEQLESTGTSVEDYHNLWPIPFSQIDRNVDAVLEQNPGYTN
ncbi:MAG: RagB/SusD family nutrient uptake outer membrane protein [Prevotella sp.]|jgi:tetratricopeptide (TPR) repeat protein|nr:RagB/SusD family nutrient uptake outer membrane protein [Prevotella sp.]